MTHQPRDDERDLRELFREARRAESRGAPALETMLTGNVRVRPPSFGRRRLLAIAFSTAVLASLAVLGAGWILVPRTEPIAAPAVTATARLVESEPVTEEPQETRFVDPLDVPAEESAPEAGPAKVKLPEPTPVKEAVARAELEPTVGPEENPPASVAAADQAESDYRAAVVQIREQLERYGQDLAHRGRVDQGIMPLPPGVQDGDGAGNSDVQVARARSFKATASGVSNPAMMTGGNTGRIAPASGGPCPREEPWNAEGYRAFEDNAFLAVTENPLSTFSIDVDTASYSNVRRFLTMGTLPPPDAVRTEELINYFDYDYPVPGGEAPFSTDVEIVDCPWNPAHRLARIGIKGREIVRGEHAGSNLVFLIDVSGSMDHPSKLPLLKSALLMLVEQLTSRDQVAIVAYAGSSGLVLDSTSGDAKTEILDAIDRLRAGGSTNGGAGLRLAYRVARENFVPGGVNRVILATDGDFNVGVTSHGGLLRSIVKDARNGIFLTALGFGYGNYQDDRLEHLADKGNGNYAYIDRLSEARKVLVEQLWGTLVTIAKDVKVQVEFNPREVGAYRLIGYENRMLKKEDFNDDRKDAGEIGAGHTVTALYELVPPGEPDGLPGVDELRYQTAGGPSERAESGESFTLKLRYKDPDGEVSHLLTFPIVDQGHRMNAASPDVRFAAAVAQFGLLLRGSDYRAAASFRSVEKLALEGAGADRHGYRAEFLDLVRRAEGLMAAAGATD